MPTYAQLQQRHPSYNAARQAELEALYEGGEKLERLYPTLLKKRPKETEQHWQMRIGEAEYRNYFGPIIDYFTSMLFTSKPVLKAKTEKGVEVAEPGEFWAAFKEDCDRSGGDIDALFKARLTDAMVTRTGWLRVHAPSDGGIKPENRADFEARRLGECWLEPVATAQVLDWEHGEDGNLEFAVVYSCSARRTAVSAERDTVTETWWWLTPATVETYRLVRKKKDTPKPTDEVARISVEPHPFGRVPLVCLDLPSALWVGNRLRSPQLAHFRKVCAQSWSMAATCYAMPVVKVQDAEEYTKQTAGAGYEIVIGQEDDYTWQAPPTGHFSALDEEIKACKDEIFRVAHQMALGVENNAAAVGRSAESKASDAESTRVVLVAFSRLVKETIELVLDLIARARGEDLTWSVEGLDDFAALDVTAFLENLKLVKDAGGIPSKTFQIEANTRAAESLLRDVDEATKQKIRKEIQAGTADPVAERERELEAALATFGPASGAKRPGNGPPAAEA